MITFKQRERTDAIRLDYHPEYKDNPPAQTPKAQREKASSPPGSHSTLPPDAPLEKGIDDRLYAHHALEGADTSIYVLVTSDRLSDMAHIALDELAAHLKLPIKE